VEIRTVRVVVVGVGSNLGAREASILCARDLLDAREGIEVRELSEIYETEPVGPPQPRYLNAAFRLETTLGAPEILRALLCTERRLGRNRRADQRWGPRSIDLDLLWDQRGPTELSGLRVPHPELPNRAFALAPLLDVVPALAEVYGPMLDRLGGSPREWGRNAEIRIESSSMGFEVDVEADALEDACALCIGQGSFQGRPWSTRHVTMEPAPEKLASALRDLFRTGFSVHRATISHCSKSQWNVQLHGINMGIPVDADVRLRTTLGSIREIRAQLSVALIRG
jgi:2-amino-4-hydroxy-6-hydroxymethyldihydropteridine diphosphokinase